MNYDILTPRIPTATYRVQFNRQFTFKDAARIVGYLSDLGISDIYSSPYFRAKAGSLHGYDIVDHNSLNPEIGTEKDYLEFIGALKRAGMGQMLDIVPNHMGIGKENLWWTDLLENGPSSLYADYFDIDWEPVKKELRNKVLIPVLGEQYGTVLENGELSLVYEKGAFLVQYYDHVFPVRPQTYSVVLGHGLKELEMTLPADDPGMAELFSIMTALDHLPSYTETDMDRVRERHREKEIIKRRLSQLYEDNTAIKEYIDTRVTLFNGVKGVSESYDLFDGLLSEQIYRLSHWRVATEEINYRRFFDINELAAIRMENEAVSLQTHQLIFRLVREGAVTGLRVDHPDGLYNPVEYFRWLQKNCFGQQAEKQYDDLAVSNSAFKPFYIVGEKILTKGERMPEDWPIFSTTGYVFLNSVSGIFVRTGNAGAFDEIYYWFTKKKTGFSDIVYEKKKLIMEVAMSSEINLLAHYLNEISELNRHTRDFTLNSLAGCIRDVIAFFPVYRTYVSEQGVNDRDRRYIEHAVDKAKRNNPAINESVFNFLKNVLLLEFPALLKETEKRKWIDFVMKFQQITGPVMAKGVEDTAFYIYNRLVSLNDVGGSPDRFGTQLETFHGQNIERIKFWPHALITTSTHDTKRSEDARARINVLSEMPDTWKQCLMRWRRLNKRLKVLVDGQPAPDANEEYLLYQSLIGIWPVHEPGQDEYTGFVDRIKVYMIKALREAKLNTSWINPNTVYEDAVLLFLERILDRKPANQFLEDFRTFQGRVSHIGMFNSLSQTLLKIASPGVPDFYQGTELWDFSLVDPDNRRPVDYGKRLKMMEELKERCSRVPRHALARELTADKADGMIKLYVTWTALSFRRDNAGLFEKGEYLPLDATGDNADHVCAFARRTGKKEALIVAPRLCASLAGGPDDLPLGKAWKDSCLMVSLPGPGQRYRNIFTEELLTVSDRDGTAGLFLAEIFAKFPLALLERID